MAGGKGERFWPLSTEEIPKPFLNLMGKKSLFEETVERTICSFNPHNIRIVLSKKYLSLAKRQAPQLADSNFIIEPEGRDTAPCIGWASIQLPDSAVVVVLPADHYIPDTEAFRKTIEVALTFIQHYDYILTWGIKPTRVETGYGYLHTGDELTNLKGFPIFKVKKFVEKPTRRKAMYYIKKDDYYWNAGIFAFRNATIQSLFVQFTNELWKGLIRIKGNPSTLTMEYKKLPKISIDYGIMEKAVNVANVAIIPASFQWDDIGTWSALERIMKEDANGNIVIGTHHSFNTRDCIIYSTSQPVVTAGISDLVIISANDKILICPKSIAGDIKKFVHQIV